MRPLTEEEIEKFKKQMVSPGHPVRFQYEGRTMNIISGKLQPRGINVIHQTVYWNFSKETAREIAALTGTKPVFDW